MDLFVGAGNELRMQCVSDHPTHSRGVALLVGAEAGQQVEPRPRQGPPAAPSCQTVGGGEGVAPGDQRRPAPVLVKHPQPARGKRELPRKLPPRHTHYSPAHHTTLYTKTQCQRQFRNSTQKRKCLTQVSTNLQNIFRRDLWELLVHKL